ncbi:hypothetical protein A4A49_41179, partial [Nicotiana attenuata]
KCIKSEAYGDAVKYYTGAMPIFKAYGDSSFHDYKRASEEAIAVIIKGLQHIVNMPGDKKLMLKFPAFNVINIGSHAGNKLAMQNLAGSTPIPLDDRTLNYLHKSLQQFLLYLESYCTCNNHV